MRVINASVVSSTTLLILLQGYVLSVLSNFPSASTAPTTTASGAWIGLLSSITHVFVCFRTYWLSIAALVVWIFLELAAFCVTLAACSVIPTSNSSTILASVSVKDSLSLTPHA